MRTKALKREQVPTSKELREIKELQEECTFKPEI
jgi:hypothetical protein